MPKKSKNVVSSAIILLFKIILVFLLIQKSKEIKLTSPMTISPNTQSSPMNIIINFQLEKVLPKTGYLMFTITPLTISVTPYSCLYLGVGYITTVCQNLNSPSIATMTINQTSINAVNPNIQASLTMVLQFNNDLPAGIAHSVQLMATNVLPNIGSITSSLEAYTVSGTGIILQENWNFGQLFLQQRVYTILNIVNINSMTSIYPGTTFSNLIFEITIGVQVPTSVSRMKIMINNQFTFLPAALVSTTAVTGSAPQVLSYQVVSENIVLATFNESFPVGRKFRLKLTNIQNPLKIASGHVSIYSLPDNSMSPLQMKQLSIPIQTVQYTPTISVLTAMGSTPSSPITFYTSTTQYITVVVLLPRIFNSNFVLELAFDLVTIHQGSAYAVASTVNTAVLNYNYVNTTALRINGFPSIPSGSTITITIRVTLGTSLSFNTYVGIDQQANLGIPIMYNQAPASVVINPTNFISGLTGNSGQTNKLTKMVSGNSFITFVVNPSFQVFAGSFLEIFVRKDLHGSATFSGSTSCLVNTVAQPCTITSNTTFTVIKIASNSSANLFPQSVATPIKINNLQYDKVSSHTKYLYHFYFKLTVSQSTNAPSQKMLIVPLVLPQRDQMTGLKNYFINQLNSSGTNFPNIFRIVSQTPADFNYVAQTYEKRIISVFSYQGWKNLFSTLTSGDSYTAGSTLSSTTFTFIKGTTTNLNSDYPLDWDRVNIILPGGQNTTKFSLILPTLYLSASAQQYQIMVGIFDTVTRQIRYLQVQPQPILGQLTYKMPASTPVTSKPKVTVNKIQLAGKAGSYISSVQITLDPSSATYNATTYSAALMTVSNWQYYDSTSSYSSVSTSSVNPIFSYIEQTPMSFKLQNTGNYFTFIPFKTTSAYPGAFSIYLNSIKLPYNHDLPYYSLYLTDQNGNIDSYNQFINQDQNVFYQSNLKALTMTCNDNSLGVINTYCTIQFKPNNQIESLSTIYISFTGMLISTDMCSFIRTDTSASLGVSTCTSNTDKNQFIVTLSNTARLPGNILYSLTVYGISILNEGISHYIDFSLRDPSGSYVVQKAYRILLTSIASPPPIQISQIVYLKNNPIVISGFSLLFTLPRPLNKDQSFGIVFSSDLNNLNTISSKMLIKIYNNANVQIPALWILNSNNNQIIFKDLYGILTTGNYSLDIRGIKTPSTIASDLISLIYLRNFDHTYTVQNTPASTTTFPSLVDKINSLITLQTLMNTEGLQQQLVFTITQKTLPVDERTIWIVNLPVYYSPLVWNQDYLIYCMIQTSKLICERDSDAPYQIKIYSSPRVVDVNTPYKIRVFGIPCPRKTYLNGNALFVTQSIFLGISQQSTSTSFTQYSQLFLTASIINPENEGGYGLVKLKNILSSNMQAFQTTFFQIFMTCTNAINANSWIYLTFPEGFDNFNDISLIVQIKYGLLNDQTSTAEVINTRLGFKLTQFSIPANTQFQIDISSLPTPRTAKTINMNKLKVKIVSSDKSSTSAASQQKENLVSTINFVSTQLHLVINNYNVIQVTAGTYSSPIKITASDGNNFLSNMKVDFDSAALSFSPKPLYMYLGQQSGQFIIGCQHTIIPTSYPFDIIKTQTSISSFYSSLSRYGVLVTNLSISITIPSIINVPYGGCSIPTKIQLTNAPYDDLSIYFEYDTSLYTLHLFWINQEISDNQLLFNSSITYRWLSFCSDSSITATNFDVSAYLRGTNEQSYKLSPKKISINIVSNTTTTPSPTMSIVLSNVQKTFASFDVTVNMKGILFYELKLAPLSPNSLSLVDLKRKIKDKNLILQTMADYLGHIYQDNRDHRVDLISLVSGINQLHFNDLLPQQTYQLCAYYENQHRTDSPQICVNFTTQLWGTVVRAQISFTKTLLLKQLNSILCFFVKSAKSQINQIVSLEGKSCALTNQPTNYNYLYSGSTQSKQLSKTVVYLFAHKNLTTDVAISTFRGLYNSSGITALSKAFALSAFSINFIYSSFLKTQFTPNVGINSSTQQFQPNITFDTPIYSGNTITINNITTSKYGAGYFILTLARKIIYDNFTGHTDIQIGSHSAVAPSSQQLLNCQDSGYNQPLACVRIVLHQQQPQNYTFTNISKNSRYRIFYAIANEYPLRPIIYGSVMNVSVDTLKQTVVFEQNLKLLIKFLVLVIIILTN